MTKTWTLLALTAALQACSSTGGASEGDAGFPDAGLLDVAGEPGQLDTDLGDEGWFDFQLEVVDAANDLEGGIVFLSSSSFGHLSADNQIQFPDASPGFRPKLMATYPDGKVLVIGEATTGSERIRRFTSDLQPDPSFSIDSSLLQDTSINDVQVTAAGELMLLGTRDGALRLAKFSATGELDTSFADQGQLLLESEGALRGQRIIIEADKSMWIGFTRQFTPCVAKVDADGGLTSSFADGVLVLNGMGPRNLRDILLTAAGELMVLGMRSDSIQVARIKSDGVLDRGFGTEGIVTHQVSLAFEQGLEARRIEADGEGGYYVLADYSRRESGSVSTVDAKSWLFHFDQAMQGDQRFAGEDKLIIDFNREQNPELVLSTAHAMIRKGDHLFIGGGLRNQSGVLRLSGHVQALWK